MAPRFIASLDQGTTSTRCILFDASGSVVSSAQREHRQIFPSSGLVEHDPEEIWARTNDVIVEALRIAGAAPTDLAALGITNQRETLVVWNRDTGRAYHNAIVWQDVRGAALCASLAAAAPGGTGRFRAQTGLPLVPYFTASKLAWCLDNVPGLRAAAVAGEALAGTIDSFLTWRLTRSGIAGAAPPLHITDVTNASRTLLFNIHSLEWDVTLCNAFNVPRTMLPRVLPSSHVYGTCAPDSVLPGVTISGILGDQQAALFGQVCFSPGDAKNTYGTGCFLLMNTGTSAPPPDSSSGLLTTIAYQIGSSPPCYAIEGSVAVAGAAISWLRDNLALIESPSAVEALAASVPDTAGAVFVPAFNGLFAPHWRDDARGVLVGLSGSVTRAHIARATLEAVAHQSRELLNAMDVLAASIIGGSAPKSMSPAAVVRDLKVDGGMTANALLMQFQADVTGRRVSVPVVAETTALGAAYAAGLAVSFWSSTDELKHHWREARAWAPVMPAAAVSRTVLNWDRALARCVGWMPTDGGNHAVGASDDPALGLHPKASGGAVSSTEHSSRSGGWETLAAVALAGVVAGVGMTAFLLKRRKY